MFARKARLRPRGRTGLATVNASGAPARLSSSVKHLHRYLSEFQFKWNHREAQDIFVLVIAALVIGSSLPYAKLIEPLAGETDKRAGNGTGRGAVLVTWFLFHGIVRILFFLRS